MLPVETPQSSALTTNEEPSGINRWLQEAQLSHSSPPPLHRRHGHKDLSIHRNKPEPSPARSVLSIVDAIPRIPALRDTTTNRPPQILNPLRMNLYKSSQGSQKAPSTQTYTQYSRGNNSFAWNSSAKANGPGLNPIAQPFTPKTPMPPLHRRLISLASGENMPELSRSQDAFGESILEPVRHAMGLPPTDYYHDPPQNPGIALGLNHEAGGFSCYYPGQYFQPQVEYDCRIGAWEAGWPNVLPAMHHDSRAEPHYNDDPFVECRSYKVPHDWHIYPEVYERYRHDHAMSFIEHFVEQQIQRQDFDGIYEGDEPTVAHDMNSQEFDRTYNRPTVKHGTKNRTFDEGYYYNRPPAKSDDDSSLCDDPWYEDHAGPQLFVGDENSTYDSQTTSQHIWSRDISGSTWLTVATAPISKDKPATNDTAQTSPVISYTCSPKSLNGSKMINLLRSEPQSDQHPFPKSESFIHEREPLEYTEWEIPHLYHWPAVPMDPIPTKSTNIISSKIRPEPQMDSISLENQFPSSSPASSQTPSSYEEAPTAEEEEEEIIDCSIPRYRFPIAMAELFSKGKRWRRRSISEGMLIA